VIVAKRVADIITWGRASLALVLVLLGLTQRAETLPLAAWLMIADWTGDCVDGPLARRSRVQYSSWIGDHDLHVDLIVAGGLLVYLIGVGRLDLKLAGLYALVWGLVFWRWGIPRSLGMLVQAPVYGWFIFVAVRDAPRAGWWVVGWILVVVVLTWPRFPKEVVPGFLHGMREVAERYRRHSG
jgi:hypothetical protein